MAIEKDFSTCIATRRSSRSRPCSEAAAGRSMREAAAQLMASLHAGTGDVQIVDIRKRCALADLPASAVVEIPARSIATAPIRSTSRPSPRASAGSSSR